MCISMRSLGSFFKPGAIARYCRNAEELRDTVGAVANVVESRGQLLDAVSLYQLAANCRPRTQSYYQIAAGIMNYLLTDLVAPDSSGTMSQTFTRAIGRPNREEVLRLATQVSGITSCHWYIKGFHSIVQVVPS